MQPPFKKQLRLETVAFEVRNAWALEIPEGDPFGGPAYGEKNKKAFKSVVKILGPIGAIAATIATGGAFLAAGGFAALSLGSFTALATGISAVGSALSAVGQVTGNEKLTKIGAIASLAGGVSLAAYNIGQTGSFVAGIDKTFDQFSEGASKGWEKLTGTPAGASTAPTKLTDTLSQSPAGTDVGATQGLGQSGLGQSASGVSGEVAGAASGAGTPVSVAANPGMGSSGLSALPQGVSPQVANAASGAGQAGAAQPVGLVNRALTAAKSFGSYVTDPANAQTVLTMGNLASSTAPYLFPSDKEEAEQKYLQELANRREYELQDYNRYNESLGGLDVGFSGEASAGIGQGFRPGQRYYQGDLTKARPGLVNRALTRVANPLEDFRQQAKQNVNGLVRRAIASGQA